MIREEELRKLADDLEESVRTVVSELIGEIVFLELKLEQLKQLPFIETNPKNQNQHRETCAARQYKVLLQQYNNCIKIVLSAIGKCDETEESPLRQYLNQMRKNNV